MNRCIKNKLEQLDLNKNFYLQNPEEYTTILRDIAFEYQKLGKYKNALESFQKVLEVQKSPYYANNFKESKSYQISKTLHSIEFLQHKLGYFPQALELATSRLLSYKQDSNISMIEISDTMFTVALLYKELQKYDYALYYFWQSFNIRNTLFRVVDSYNLSDDEYTWQSDILNVIEFVYYKAGYYTEALSLSEERLKLYQEIYDKDHTIISDTMVTLAVLHEAMRNYEDSLAYLQKAMLIDNQISSYIVPEILNDLQTQAEYFSKDFVESYKKNRHTIDVGLLLENDLFFKAVTLGLELPQCLSNLLMLEVIKYINNNTLFFFDFSDHKSGKISSVEKIKELIIDNPNLYRQGFSDLFGVNIIILDQIQDCEFSIISRTDNNPSTIHLSYNEDSYNYLASNNFTINNYFTILTDKQESESYISVLIGDHSFS